MVCGDREMLDDAGIDAIAGAVVEAQVEQVASGIRRCMRRFRRHDTAVVTGLGDFIAADAARRAGLEVVPLSEHWGPTARVAPAAAVGWLLAEAGS